MVLTTLVIIHTVLICITTALLVAVIMLVMSRVSCNEEHYSLGQRIVGGKVVSIKDHPFMAAIVVKKHGMVPRDSIQCGSSIIAKHWILTAAHCLVLLKDQSFDKSVVYISSGSSIWTNGKKHTILDWTYHRSYNREVMNDDIALMKVQQPFEGELSRPIALANERYNYPENTDIMVIGWGLLRSSEENPQKILRGVVIKLYNQTYCKDLYRMQGQPVTKSMFCAGVQEGGKDACQFDSGGPIFHKDLLIGVVSWGMDCAQVGQPGVYTRVGLYEQWIRSETRKMGAPINAKFRDKP